MSNLIYILLFAGVVIISGCASAPIVPQAAMPKTPKIKIYGTMTTATPQLDCLSRELCAHHPNDEVLVLVGDLRNTFAENIGEQQLPRSMRPMVQNSLGRISCVYKQAEPYDITGIQGLSNALPSFAGAYPDIVRNAYLGDLTQPSIILTGSLYMGQSYRSATIEGELYNLGLGGQARAFDVNFQLKAIDAKNRRFKIPPVSLKARIFEAENGGSAFYLDTSSGNLSRGRATFKQAASLSDALQLLSDRAVAAVVRNLSTNAFQRSFSLCDQEITELDPTQFPDQASRQAGKKFPLTIQVYRKSRTVCMRAVKNSLTQSLYGHPLHVVWIPYSAQETLQVPGEKLGGSVPAHIINNGGEVCLPPSEVLPHTQSYEVRIKNGQKIIGVGVL